MILAQLSDPHLKLDDETSQPALRAAVERARAFRPDAVLVTGDIADTGDPREHALADALLAFACPVLKLAGNHDRLAAPLQYVHSVGDYRIVVCDTSQPGRDDGSLNLEWLEAQLGDGPTIIAMHHPPVLMGLAWLDEIGLPEYQRSAFAALLSRSPQVVRVLAGHVHRASFHTLGGCPVITCAGTNIQSALDFEAPGMELVNEPPSLLIHTTVADGLITHVQPI